MTRRQKRKIIIIAVLVLLLLLLAAYFAYFRSTRKLTFDIDTTQSAAEIPPEYLYSFSGSETDRLARPVGVLVLGQEVYVTDSRQRKVYRFDIDGNLKGSFGGTTTVIPLYMAEHPKTRDLYISDRRTRSIHIFGRDGKFKGDFDPKLPKDQLPKFKTGGVQWAPVALAFAPDGRLYVTEILNGHRLLIFSPEGKFVRSVGTVGMVTNAAEGPNVFQFPNSVKIHKDEVWIADSNNRRIQVFDLDGEFKRIVKTEGLPRGIDFLPRRASEESGSPEKLVVVDTLAHDGTLWAVAGEKILSFGQRGVLEGQFSYPNDVSVGPKSLIFITDSANGRVQVWGWPEEVSPIPIPTIPAWWRLCLTPLLLLPLLLLLRKKRFFATRDFVQAMIDAEMVDLMPHRRRRWVVKPEDHEFFEGVKQGDIDLGELLEPTDHSESDAQSLMERLELDHDTAVTLSIAQRAKVFCTQDEELRRLAKLLEVDVVDRDEFLERFAGKRTPTPPSGGAPSEAALGSSPDAAPGPSPAGDDGAAQ